MSFVENYRLGAYSLLTATSFVLALSACGKGGVAPRDTTVPPSGNGYRLQLNDTGVKRYINGLYSPGSPDGFTQFNVTSYWYYATSKVYILANIHKIPNRNTTTNPYTVISNDNVVPPQKYDWKLTPNCDRATTPKCTIYDLDGRPHFIDLYFTNTAPDTVNVRVILDNTTAIVNTTLGADLIFDSNGLLSSIDRQPLSINDNRWLKTTAPNIPFLNIELQLSHRSDSGNTSYGDPNQDGCASNSVDNACWKHAPQYSHEGVKGGGDYVYDLRASPPKWSTSGSLSYPDQDADFGLDKTQANGSDRGFRFEKLVKGAVSDKAAIVYVEGSSDDWECVHDLNTGLYWEHKTNFSKNLRSAESSFSWYDSNPKTNGGHPGSLFKRLQSENDVQHSCNLPSNVNCNTEEYIKEINNIKLCGYGDWRQPTMLELYTLIDFSLPRQVPELEPAYVKIQDALKQHATLDRKYFPNAPADDVWTSQTMPNLVDYARALHLDRYQTAHLKDNAAHVMLVRGLTLE